MFDLFKKKVEYSPEEKASALCLAVKYWSNKEYQKATELCKKYNISTDTLASANLAYQRSQPLSVNTKEKASALQLALKYWNNGEYAKAMKICKKYGISDRDFSYAMVQNMHKE